MGSLVGEEERPLTVLVVDSNADYRHLVVGVLKENGYDVLAASDGQDALELISYKVKTNAIVVLTGLALPTLNGRRMLKAIEHEDWSKFVVVVVITGEQKPDLPASTWWVQKPVGVEELLGIVGQARGVLFDRFVN